MCELFGFTASSPAEMNPVLQTFYSHSTQHPDGWGLAVFDGGQVNIEKEPVAARESAYLNSRLSVPVRERLVLAHIRKASPGLPNRYANTHPFSGTDAFGKRWVFIHNGDLFSEPDAEVFARRQAGTTDSERILLRFLEAVRRRTAEPDPEGCMEILGELMEQLCIGNNKINMMLSDGVFLYLYANHADKLWLQQKEGQITASTLPLSEDGWERAPERRVLLCRDGQLLRTGDCHGQPYIPPETT